MRCSRSAHASMRSPQPTLAFRESDVALRRTRRHVIGTRRCVRRTRERTKVDATVPSMDVSLPCIERNHAYTEQMPHVRRTESCVRGPDASRHATRSLRTCEPGLACTESTVAYPERKLVSLGRPADDTEPAEAGPAAGDQGEMVTSLLLS